MDETALLEDVERLTALLDRVLQERVGGDALALIRSLRDRARALRLGELSGGREAFARRFHALPLDELALIARTFTQHFLLLNAAEEQHRLRVLRGRDRPGHPPAESIASACGELRRGGITAGEIHELLERLLVMPVLTAHPSEARRSTVLDHLESIAWWLDRLDDPRLGHRELAAAGESLAEAVLALHATEESRAAAPTPLDEVRAGLQIFERTLLEVTPPVIRELEEALSGCWPEERFQIGPFLRWGSWIGGDRDGNPNVTAEVTQRTLEAQRDLVLRRYRRDLEALGRELSVSARLTGGEVPLALAQSIREDGSRFPGLLDALAERSEREPWRAKLVLMGARLEATSRREDRGYAGAHQLEADLRLIEATLRERGLRRLARGALRDTLRRVEVFGFHLASLDVRQHSQAHERAVSELLARGGIPSYGALEERRRCELLVELLERPAPRPSVDRAELSATTREVLDTVDVVARARRELGPAACERWVISFTHGVSDVLEVLWLARQAGIELGALRPVPLLEQLEDLENAESFASRLLRFRPIRRALGGELEVMIGYSDSSKQAGYVASAVALRDAQIALARACGQEGLTLTVFHGRGGAVGRGGGPANRAIRSQPREALAGRFRVTEQGETVAARYGRREIARRDMEQMVHAVLLGSLLRGGEEEWDRGSTGSARAEPLARGETSSARAGRSTSAERTERTLRIAASAAHSAYAHLVSDRPALTAYMVRATPIEHIARLRIASRPPSRTEVLTYEDLRAIPWVFSWNQSRHGIPGWFGVGAALEAIVQREGLELARTLYAQVPFIRALIDNAQLALVRADIDVAAQYARLAGPEGAPIFEAIRAEHARTVRWILEVVEKPELLAGWPTIARTVRRRNPFVDVLSHVQIELMRRLREPGHEPERARLEEVVLATIHGIAAGLQTAG